MLFIEAPSGASFFMAAPIKIDLDTELSAVNSILGAIGQAPVTRLADHRNKTYTQGNNTVTIPELQFEDPQVAFVYQLLMEMQPGYSDTWLGIQY